jgi:hypothetical protein
LEVIRPDEEPVSKTGGGDEPLVGSSPTASASQHSPFESQSRGPAATTPGLHPGNDGSSPSGTNLRRRNDGPPEARSGIVGPRGAARSARHPVTVEIVGSNPTEDACVGTRYANWQSDEAQTFAMMRVQLPPVSLISRVGWALACPSGCNPPAFGQCRFDSCSTH